MWGLRAAGAATAGSCGTSSEEKAKNKLRTFPLFLSNKKQIHHASQVLEAAAEAGAEDAIPTSSNNRRWRVLTAVDQFGAVRDALSAAGFPVAADASGLEWIPKTPVNLKEDLFDANEKLYQKLLEVTDVDAVFCSCPGVGVDDEEEEE